jgi:hypothetical protein
LEVFHDGTRLLDASEEQYTDFDMVLFLALLPTANFEHVILTGCTMSSYLLPPLVMSCSRNNVRIEFSNIDDIHGKTLKEHRSWALIKNAQDAATCSEQVRCVGVDKCM